MEMKKVTIEIPAYMDENELFGPGTAFDVSMQSMGVPGAKKVNFNQTVHSG